MGLLDIFSGKDPEDYEMKGDKLVGTGAYGKAIVEYERALERLEKTAPWDDGFRQSLREKIHSSRETLVLQHKKTAADMIEAGYHEDARQYIQLALELTEDPDQISDLENQKRELEARALEDIQTEEAEVEITDPEEAQDDEPVGGEPDDEYFAALVVTLPEDVQKAYLEYGDTFKKGYLALNQGDFELAAEYLYQALEENPDLPNYIPLELATACLNLGQFEDGRRLLEEFLQHQPNALPAYQLLCEIFWETKDFDRAEALLSALPGELAKSVAGYVLRGETLYHAENYKEAKAFYRDFLKTYDWNETIARGLAKTHEALNEMANARNIYREIMDQYHSCHSRIDPYIKQKYADLSFASGLNTTEVLELYLSLVREVPGNKADFYQKVSRIYTAQGNETEARRFELFAEKAQKDPQASSSNQRNLPQQG
ncbi:MAG: tetratricopeptide repeat protein [Proteobacteria bacterium]|nr:tetratricopeptide repeat protein [Pseudomonadota bacterium]